MLPNNTNRTSCTTIISPDDNLQELNVLPPQEKLPSPDFNAHFIIKSTTSSTVVPSAVGSNNIQPDVVSSEVIPPARPPSIVVSECPDIDIPVRPSPNDLLLFSQPANEPQTVFNRPTASTSTTLTSLIDATTMSSPPPQTRSSTRLAQLSTPSTPSPSAPSPRRTSSVQHPFMKSPRSHLARGASSPQTSILAFPDSPMDYAYQPVSPFCLKKNKMGRYEITEDGSDDGDGGRLRSGAGAALSDYETILKVCAQRGPIPLDMIFNGVKNIEKIGEGVYGEVYSATFRYFSQCSWVYKVVAIAGDEMVNGEKQKGFLEVLPEVVVSQELSKLKGVLNKCYTDGYAFMKNARIARGKYPWSLLQPWEKFHSKYESDNDKPDFAQDQLYMVLEFEFAGQDIESLSFRDARQTLSIVLQVAHILAVGEFALEFEHRDLHWGNILVQNWQTPTIRYLINNETFHVPSIGIKAAVIDFTISRVKSSETNNVTYLDLQDDEEQFLGTGDHQFDIYRMMRDHNRNDWQSFCPKTNIFWLHYLANKLYVKGQYNGPNAKSSTSRRATHHQRAVRKLKEFANMILDHASTVDFVFSKECKAYRDFLGTPVVLADEPSPSTGEMTPES